MRVAGGVQFKILEALALGVPVVTSPEGFEGLGARGEEDGVVVARDAREFARAALELMRDRGRGAASSPAARQSFIAERYDWDRQVARSRRCSAAELEQASSSARSAIRCAGLRAVVGGRARPPDPRRGA